MATLVQALLAVVMVVASIAKLEDRDRFMRSLSALPWLSPEASRKLSVGVPLAELSTFALLVVVPRVGAGAALALLAGFTLIIANELLAGRRFDCGCFGSLASGTVGISTLVRNGVLCGLAVALLALPYSFELPAVLTGIGLGLLAVTIDLTTSTITRERFR